MVPRDIWMTKNRSPSISNNTTGVTLKKEKAEQAH
jgi:hypothetical protein